MKKILFTAVLALTLIGQALAAEGVAWGRIRWGMQPQDVSAAIGQMVRAVDNPGRFTHQTDNLYRGYRLAFTFFGKRGLERLALIDADTAGLPERYSMIREALTLKYGAPFNSDSSGNVCLLEWMDAEKLVQLHYRVGGGQPIMNILYIWRKSAMAEEY